MEQRVTFKFGVVEGTFSNQTIISKEAKFILQNTEKSKILHTYENISNFIG